MKFKGTAMKIQTDNFGTFYLHPSGSKYYADCPTCEQYKSEGITFFPSHAPSPFCQSGRQEHCTCDWCF